MDAAPPQPPDASGGIRVSSNGNNGSGCAGGRAIERDWQEPPRLKPSARVVLGAAALALANWSYTAELFLSVEPVGAEGRTAAPATDAPPAERRTSAVGGAWERRVRVARNELARVRDEVEKTGEGHLLLNVNADVDLDMVVERTASTAWGYSLSGRIEGRSVGFVTLVVHPQAVSASIWTPDASYEVVPLGGGVHAVRDVTNEPIPECAGAVHPERTELAIPTRPVQQGAADDVSVVDILVVWTPARENEAGSEAHVKSQIALAIAYTNDALERSGAFVSLNLVGAEMVDYEEADSSTATDRENSSTDLDRLVDSADGHMDRVHTLRDMLGADLVSLATSRYGGRAQIGGSFSVAGLTPRTFAHEVGHNMWLGHSHRNLDAAPGGFHHGFIDTSTSVYCIMTIMSYPGFCGTEVLFFVPYFSSPWAYNAVDGRPLGVSRFSKERGQDGQANAVLMINRHRHQVANKRRSRSTTR